MTESPSQELRNQEELTRSHKFVMDYLSPMGQSADAESPSQEPHNQEELTEEYIFGLIDVLDPTLRDREQEPQDYLHQLEQFADKARRTVHLMASARGINPAITFNWIRRREQDWAELQKLKASL